MAVKFGVVRFPGSNCDQDAYYAVKDVLQQPVDYLWHEESDLKGSDVVVIPGGFSYGDYLRCGAIARFSPVMKAVQDFAAAGGIVFGVCNGFQVLCEAQLLPGALVRNEGLRFVCKHVPLRVENSGTKLTSLCSDGDSLCIPVAHGEGKYVCDEKTLAQLKENGQVIFRYESAEANPNGSVDNIAGIANESFNVFGMMPHPERACDLDLGSADGLVLFQSLVKNLS
ncbi:MAG TPA: phosphoribosylformylglycinamidine synthase subunit PurQ [Capsulimonadaceae bacterium]|nr:phosphoribosylformylglycinamidine synthase subunit PurQ [Capsulimonadaceae bacterium]